MRVYIAGGKGLLGSYLTKYLIDKGEDVISVDREVNILNYSMVRSSVLNIPIDIIINCAAYTNVPGAEINRKEASRNNIFAVGVLGKISLEKKALMVHFSTDFVFDGLSKIPYKETDSPDPLSFYGFTKYMGERALKKKLKYTNNFLIFRLQWLYGNNPKTFFMKVLEKAKKGEPIGIVDDEFGSPTSVKFVTESLYEILFKRGDISNFKGKIYHLTHEDYCSRYESAKYFLEKMELPAEIVPVYNIEDTVKRPKFGVLDSTLLKESFNVPLKSWKEDVDDFIRELKC